MRDIFCALTLAEYSALVALETEITFGDDPKLRKLLRETMRDIRGLGTKRATDLSIKQLKEELSGSSFSGGNAGIC